VSIVSVVVDGLLLREITSLGGISLPSTLADGSSAVTTVFVSTGGLLIPSTLVEGVSSGGIVTSGDLTIVAVLADGRVILAGDSSLRIGTLTLRHNTVALSGPNNSVTLTGTNNQVVITRQNNSVTPC